MNEKPLRLAMHGFGYIGRMHVLAAQTATLWGHTDVDVQFGVCVVRDESSQSAQKATRVFARVTDNLDELATESFDALDIVSPNHVHHLALQPALKARAAVYCEKPLSNDLATSQQMTQAVESTGITNQVALIYRFHPAVEHARTILRSGQLGRVLTFRAELLHGGYLNPQRRMAWRLQSEASGAGAIMDLGVHLFDTVRLLLGEVARVHANLQTFVQSRPDASGQTQHVQVDDWASVTLELASGAVGTVEVSRVHYEIEQSSLKIICENGTIDLPLDHISSAIVHTLDGLPIGQPVTSPLAEFRPVKKTTEDVLLSCHTASIATFLHRACGGAVDYPLPTFRDALKAEQLVSSAIASNQSGEWVTVPKGFPKASPNSLSMP